MAKKVYLGRDNAIYPVLYQDGSAYTSLASVTKMTLHFGDTTISSDDYSDYFDWTTEANTGEVVMRLGVPCQTEGVSAGAYRAELYVFDSTNTNGVFWGYIPVVVVDLSS